MIKSQYIARLLACLMTIYVLLSVALSYTLHLEVQSAYSHYFLVLMVGMALIAFDTGYKLTKVSWPDLIKIKLNKKLMLIALFGIGLMSFNIVQEMKTRPIWLDEYTQFKKVIDSNTRLRNIVTIAASEQQPPIDYYLSSFAYRMFGWKEYAPRFHAILSYVLLTLLLFIYIWERHRSHLTLAVGMALYFLTPVIRYYSVEGRPTSLSCLFIAIYFLEAIRFFEVKEEKFSPHLFLAIFLPALSIGIQTQLIIFIFSLITFFILISDSKRSAYTFLAHNVLVAALCLPIYYLIYKESQTTHQFHSLASWYEIIAHKFSLAQFSKIYSLGITYSKFEPLFWLGLHGFSIYQAFKYKRLSNPLIFFYSLFPVMLYIFFILFINWYFQSKYYICFTLISIVYFMDIIPLLLQKIRETHRCVAFGVLVCALAAGATYSRYNLKRFQDIHIISPQMYASFDNPGYTNIAMNFNLAILGQWRGWEWISREIYGTNDVLYHVSLEDSLLHNFQINWKKIPMDKEIKIHLLVVTRTDHYRNNVLEWKSELLEDAKIVDFGFRKVITFTWPVEKARENWERFLTRLEALVPEEYQYMFIERKMASAIFEKRYDDCLKLKDEYLKIKTVATSDGGGAIDAQRELLRTAELWRCEIGKP